MANLDLKKTLKHLYKPSAKDVSIVDIPPMNYLMIDGTGNPGTSATYDHAVKALYTLSYNIRAICKADDSVFTVMPLEGLWEFEGQGGEVRKLTVADKDSFIWTLMILQPEFVTGEIVAQARETAAKKKDAPELLANVRFESYHEGEAVQLMHIGSYDDEAPTVARLHAYIDDNNHAYAKKHHEIYLSDPRKVAPEKLKTVIRQPFTRK